MPGLQNIIDRFDEETCQEIIGKPACSILMKMEQEGVKMSRYKQIIYNLYSFEAMLMNQKIREIIIDTLYPTEVSDLLFFLTKEEVDDPYTRVKILLKKFQEERFQKLYQFFGLTYEERKEEAVSFETVLGCQYPLYAHQRKAIADVIDHLNRYNRILLHMPTGSGKTRSACHSICYHLILNEPTVVVWLANTEELCNQTAKEMEKAWTALGNREIAVVKYWEKSKADLKSVKDGVVICGLAKLNQLLVKDSLQVTSLASKCSYIIMDEAHMAIAPTYKNLIDLFINTNIGIGREIKFLGLSATPGRTYNDPDEDLKLAQVFGGRKVVLQVDGYSNPMDYLVAEGYLAKINNIPLRYEDARSELITGLNIPAEVIRKLSEDEVRNILIVKKVSELVKRHKRIILFAITVEHSDLLAATLQALNVNAKSITTKTDPVSRKAYINEYLSDSEESIVLCNYGILTTGFDAPRTSCAVITRPTSSLVLYSQMVGRAIRGEKVGGNKEAEIVTVVDTSLPGFGSLASTFFNWDDVYESSSNS